MERKQHYLSHEYRFLGDDGGGVFKSTNGGSNWNAINSGMTSDRKSVV